MAAPRGWGPAVCATLPGTSQHSRTSQEHALMKQRHGLAPPPARCRASAQPRFVCSCDNRLSRR